MTKRKRWLTMAAAGVAAIVVSGAPAWGGEISGTVGIDSAATASAGAVRVRSGVPAFTGDRPAFPAETPGPFVVDGLTGARCVHGPLGLGAVGSEVRVVQWTLRAFGSPVAVDGTFGSSTWAALRSLQDELGLRPSGAVDRATLAALHLGCGDDAATVAVLGDSLFVFANEGLVRALVARGFRVIAFDAVSGSRMAVTYTPGDGAQRVALADRMASVAAGGVPDLWVVSSGGNDVLQVAASGGEFDEVVSSGVAAVLAASGGAPVVWVEPFVSDQPSTSGDERAASARLSGVLSSGQVTLAPWFSVADGSVGLLADGIHPTLGAGRAAFSAVVLSGVDAVMSSGAL